MHGALATAYQSRPRRTGTWAIALDWRFFIQAQEGQRMLSSPSAESAVVGGPVVGQQPRCMELLGGTGRVASAMVMAATQTQ